MKLNSIEISNFEKKFVKGKPDECWEWTAYKDKDGYGRVTLLKKPWAAHRIAYELYVGLIPVGMLIRHTCDNTSCVNPKHFLLGTNKENSMDMSVRGRCRKQNGEKNSYSILTENKITRVREYLSMGIFTNKEIGSFVGCCESNISKIKHGHTWVET